MSKPLPQLPKEVWTCIAYHLRKPFPQPRDVKERKEVRQVDLVSLMRTSKLLNNATTPALYSLVITDDISGLYHNFFSPHPVAPGILSKRELLHFTRALFLEYPTRPLSPFHDQNMFTFHYKLPRVKTNRFDDLNNDIGCFYSDPALATLIDAEMLFATHPDTQLQVAMPELEVLGCGTFFGSYEDGWTTNFGGTLGYMRRVGEVQKLFTRMLLDSGIQHFCQSGNFNPLAIHPVELHSYTSSSPPPLKSITLHVDLKKTKNTDYDNLFSSSSSLPGVRVRWCFDDPRHRRSTGELKPFLDFPDQPLFAKTIFLSIVSGMTQRHDKHDVYKGEGEFPLVPFIVDAYIPMTDATAKMLTKDVSVRNPRGSSAKDKAINKKRAAAEQLGTALGTELFHTSVEKKVLHPDDHLGVHYVADYPGCACCGWVAKA